MYNPTTTYNNTFIRNIYSPGSAYLQLSYFKLNLNLGFTPWVGTDNRGLSIYDKNKFLSTTIDFEKAAALYITSKKILDQKEDKAIQLTLNCNKQTTLHLDYSPDNNGQMRARFTIEKQGQHISIIFNTAPYKYKDNNGQVHHAIMQVGLGVFMKTLDAYLCAIGAERHLNKLSEEEMNNPPESLNW